MRARVHGLTEVPHSQWCRPLSFLDNEDKQWRLVDLYGRR